MPEPRAVALRRLFLSNRFTLGMALLVAVAAPEAAHSLLTGATGNLSEAPIGEQASITAAILAIVAGHVSLRKVANIPLAASKAVVLPTFCVTFGMVSLGLLSAHLSFGRYHLWTGLTLAVTWYLAHALIEDRINRPVVGLFGVPSDPFRQLGDRIVWHAFSEPTHLPNVNAIIIDPHTEFTIENSEFIAALVLKGTPVFHSENFLESFTGKLEFNKHADINFGQLLPSLTYIKIKRLIDISVALILFIPFVVVIFISAILVRSETPGPVFYAQRRMGFRGSTFTCYKLRTMLSGNAGPSYTEENDTRVTKVGRYLRKWRVDELPQIWNVLSGDMSWIGPRPEAADLAEHYASHLPFYNYRHAVRPGISGWAAVHQGNVAEVDAAREKLAYDFYYIKNHTLWLDLLIVLKTLQTVISGFGSR